MGFLWFPVVSYAFLMVSYGSMVFQWFFNGFSMDFDVFSMVFHGILWFSEWVHLSQKNYT